MTRVLTFRTKSLQLVSSCASCIALNPRAELALTPCEGFFV